MHGRASQSSTQSPQLPSQVAALPVKKAGLLIYGRARGHDSDDHAQINHRTLVLSGLSDRYDGQHLFPTLSKGGVEKDETPLQAAVRETYEETGVSLETLLGQEAFGRFMRGARVENLPRGANGVRVISADPSPAVDHTYRSRHGKKERIHLFAIELDGIEGLTPQLKGAQRVKGKHFAQNSYQLAAERGLPDYKELVTILRTGKFDAQKYPDWHYEEGKACLFRHPMLPKLEAKDGIQCDITEYLGGLLKHLKAGDKKHHRRAERLESQIKDVKRFLEGMGGGIGDTPDAALKLDVKDRPLSYYEEAACLLPVGEVIRRSYRGAWKTGDYDAAMWAKQRSADGRIHIDEAQIAALTKFFGKVAPMELAAAAINKEPKRQVGENPEDGPVMLSAHLLGVMEDYVPASPSDPAWAEYIRRRSAAPNGGPERS